MSIRAILLALSLSLTAMSAAAFERNFPLTTKRGVMTPDLYPAVLINGKARNLSAGARIWNQDNLIEQPSSLRERGVPVNYTENDHGEIDRIWMLRPEEARVPLPRP